MAAVQQTGNALEFASCELQADREFVMAAVQQTGNALEYASRELQADRVIVMAAVQQTGYAVKSASIELQADSGIVMAAVQKKGDALAYVDRKFRADRAVVMAAVQQDASVLLYAAASLSADPFLKRFAAMNKHSQTECLFRVAVHAVRFKLRLYRLREAREVAQFEDDWREAQASHVMCESQLACFRIGWECGRKRARME
jgi:hypothetical protein